MKGGKDIYMGDYFLISKGLFEVIEMSHSADEGTSVTLRKINEEGVSEKFSTITVAPEKLQKSCIKHFREVQ